MPRGVWHTRYRDFPDTVGKIASPGEMPDGVGQIRFRDFADTVGEIATRARTGAKKAQTPSALSAGKNTQTPCALQPIIPMQFPLDAFPLPWSHYVRLMSVKDDFAGWFYEAEAIQGGWSVRQLDRQIGTQFYERTALSRNKEAMILKGRQPRPEDAVTLEEAMRDPYLLEFLNLKDEYSETDLEEAILQHLQEFLLEMGDAFAFVARQKRIRIGDTWYRMDLVLFHRDLQCLVILDLKIGAFSHADAGQMNLYLNYATKNMKRPWEAEPETDPVQRKERCLVEYAMGGIQAKVFASKYLTALPKPETLRQEIIKTQQALAYRSASKGEKKEP
jgi:predicted nuclease of restriction endonuclease-like (RecB) superfamily